MTGSNVGGRYRALLILLHFSMPSFGQVSVLNGLSHFSPCMDPSPQFITVYNASDSACIVFIEMDTTDRPEAFLSIPSEVVVQARERKNIPFEWTPDSLAHFANLLIYEQNPPAVQHASGWAIQTQIRFAVRLYYGCLCSQPEVDIQAHWTDGLDWQPPAKHYWIAKSQAYHQDGRALGPAEDLFLAPFGQSVKQLPPSDAAYVIAYDEKGNHIGIRRHARPD